VGGQVGDASDGIALDLDIGRVHLLDEGSQATEGDNGDLVLGCGGLAAVDAVCVCCGWMDVLLTARLPRAALAARWTSRSGFWSRNRMGSRVSRSTSRTSGRVSVEGECFGRRQQHTSFCDFGKGQAGGALQINVVRVDEGAQCVEGLAREEIGLGALRGSAALAGSMQCGAWSVEGGAWSRGQGAGSRGRLGRYIFKEAEQVSNSLALAVGQDGVVDAVF
jgi:hypothetical protein